MTGRASKLRKATARMVPDLAFERVALEARAGSVAGVDEAGRGPLAGPVVAGAVILDLNLVPDGLNDSKALSPARRDALFDEIVTHCDWGVGVVEPEEIDEINILQATMKAMRLAVEDLNIAPVSCLIDGNRCPALSCHCEAIVKGDARSLSIAAASIVAKVTRDRIMVALDDQYPGYGWAKNMGYGTKVHLEALTTLGPSPEHRKSFAPVRNVSGGNVQVQQKGR